jgi:hypothetical protein
MLALAVLGGGFLEDSHGHFAPLEYLFGSGLGTNIGASIIWGFLAGLLGVFIARKLRRAWARLHSRIDDLHVRHDEHAEALRAVHDKLDRLLD